MPNYAAIRKPRKLAYEIQRDILEELSLESGIAGSFGSTVLIEILGKNIDIAIHADEDGDHTIKIGRHDKYETVPEGELISKLKFYV